MSFFSDLASGGVEGLTKGIGSLAKDIRTAITGKEPLSSEQQSAMLERISAIEAAAQKLENDAASGQIELNKIDAASGSIFKGGWRPAIGWICASGLAYTFILRPILWWVIQTTMTVMGKAITILPMPALDMKDLMALTMCLLGFGGFRMYEKINGKASK